MTSRDARRDVAEKFNFSEKAVELRAREWKRAAIAHLHAEKVWHDANLRAVFDAFGDTLDEVDAAHIIAAARALRVEADTLGRHISTHLRWPDGRNRFLELIRTFAA